jgi:hypothetical protein
VQRDEQDVRAARIEAQPPGEAVRIVRTLGERVEDPQRRARHDRARHRHRLERLEQRRRNQAGRHCEPLLDALRLGGDPHSRQA